MNDWGTHGGSRGSRKARLLVLWKPWNCGPTVSTAYDYCGKENKNDGPTSEASGFITCPPNRVRLNLSFLSAGLALTSLFFVCVIGMMNE